jgi:hypothetical protein
LVARITKRKANANLIFPWGSFISLTSLVCGIAASVKKRNEQKKPVSNVFYEFSSFQKVVAGGGNNVAMLLECTTQKFVGRKKFRNFQIQNRADVKKG